MMTTIVYDHKNRQIACDGRKTRANLIVSDQCKKWTKLEDGGYLFICGAPKDTEKFIEAMSSGKAEKDLDLGGILVKPDGKVYLCSLSDNLEYWESETTDNEAIGSGDDFGLAALDFKCSAKEAVEYAMTRDSGTGGKVSVFDCETMRR